MQNGIGETRSCCYLGVKALNCVAVIYNRTSRNDRISCRASHEPEQLPNGTGHESGRLRIGRR